jgi:hypothetical protein
LTSLPTESSSPITSSLTSQISPFPRLLPPPLSPTSTCPSISTLCPPLSYHPSLQVRPPHRLARPLLCRSPPHSLVRPQHPMCRLARPHRLVRPRRPQRRPAWRPGPTLLRTATCDLGVPSIASSGPGIARRVRSDSGISRIATCGPVVPLHQSHPDVPAPRSWRSSGLPSRRAPAISSRHRPSGSSPHPPDGHPARGWCPSGP